MAAHRPDQAKTGAVTGICERALPLPAKVRPPCWPPRPGPASPTSRRAGSEHRGIGSLARPVSFTGVDDTLTLAAVKAGRGAPDRQECDFSRIAILLRRVHLFRAEYFVG